MQRWIWVIIAVSVSTAVYFTIRYGLRPKPIPVLNPTQFQSADQIGVVIYKRLRQNIRAERVVLLGVGRDEDREVWEGLARAATADGEKLVVLRAGDFQTDGQARAISEMLKRGQLVVVEGPTAEVSHLVEGSLSKKLDAIVKHPVLSISTLRLAINAEEQDQLQTECLDRVEDIPGQYRLSCAAQKVARKYLKRHLEPEKIWAVMERHGLKEYLVFIHRPGDTSPEASP